MIKEEVIQILNENNGNTKAAAKILQVSHAKLLGYCCHHKLDYKLEKKRINIDNLQELYDKLGSLSLVAKEIGATKEGVRLAMKRLDLNVKAPIKRVVDHNFFSQDNELSFYWAGFWAADGNIAKHRDALKLTLALKDESHVLLFRDTVKSDCRLRYTQAEMSEEDKKEHPNWNDSYAISIYITSSQMVKDLQRFNVVPAKTKIYTFPDSLVSHPLVHHFMRGYFDGDGSWYIPVQKKPTKQIYFSLRGTELFLEPFRSILEKQCDLEIRKTPIRINTNCGVLEYGGNGITTKIKDFLYKDATVYLKRKFDIVNSITQTHTVVL